MRMPIRNERRRGFTAVEIAMVATIIAIIALLVLPVYRSRVEAARLAAVQDELSSFAKIQLLVEADTGMQARLQDLDNTSQYDLGLIGPDMAVPIAQWNGTLGSVVPKSRTSLETDPDSLEIEEAGWKGPYMAAKNTLPLIELDEYWFDGSVGFIYVVGNATGTPLYNDPVYGAISDDVDLDRYPVDPWGQPYVFYGPGAFPYSSAETIFNSSIIYSMGPNGLPGDGAGLAQPFDDLTRFDRFPFGDVGAGAGDDFDYRF